MLVALQIQQRRPYGWRQKAWERFRRAGEVRSHFVSVEGGHYVQIVAECDRRGRVDWKEIRRVAGNEATRLLLPGGITLPPDMGLAPFAGHALRQALMLQTAQHLLRTVPSLSRRPVVFYDPQARYPHLIQPLIPLSAGMQIVTARPQGYQRTAQLAMDQHGACLPMTDDLSCIAQAVLAIAPDGMEEDTPLPRGWVLSGMDHPRPRTITGYVPAACSVYMHTLPPGCDIWWYLAGLYELSSISRIGEEPPLALCAGSQHLSMADIGWHLAGLDIGISV